MFFYGCYRDHGHGLCVAMAMTALVVSVAIVDDIASIAMSVLCYVISADSSDGWGARQLVTTHYDSID